jgi:hypothetical protein
MSHRACSLWLWLSLAFLTGAVLAFVMVPVAAHTAAIAAPASLFGWFKSHGLLPLALFSWATLVVYGLSIALPAAASLLLLFRLPQRHHPALAASLGLGVLFSAYVLVPLYSHDVGVSPFILPWWQHGLVASLLLGFNIAVGASRALH